MGCACATVGLGLGPEGEGGGGYTAVLLLAMEPTTACPFFALFKNTYVFQTDKY
jgi:hypothetical protein